MLKMSAKKYKIGKLLLLCIILFNIAVSLSILNSNTISKAYTINQNIIHTSAVTSNTSQWLENSDFSSQESWESQIEGDNDYQDYQ